VLTTYGPGVALLAPAAALRVKSAWQPIDGLLAEVVGVWLPALALLWLARRRAAAGGA
jgi:hypothetical protein